MSRMRLRTCTMAIAIGAAMASPAAFPAAADFRPDRPVEIDQQEKELRVLMTEIGLAK